MKGKFRCVSQDGSVVMVKPRMTLEEMQKWVGGYIEIYDGVVCNEDGIALGLKQNVIDTRFLGNIIFTGEK
jgi:hypothetical protein